MSRCNLLVFSSHSESKENVFAAGIPAAANDALEGLFSGKSEACNERPELAAWAGCELTIRQPARSDTLELSRSAAVGELGLVRVG